MAAAVALAPAGLPSPRLMPDGDDHEASRFVALKLSVQRRPAAGGGGEWPSGNELGFGGLGVRPVGAAYIAAIPTLIGGRLRTIGAGDPTTVMTFPCLKRARPFSRAVLVLDHGPKWRPRHGHGCGSCQAQARRLSGRAVSRPCFLLSSLGRPSGLGPFGKL